MMRVLAMAYVTLAFLLVAFHDTPARASGEPWVVNRLEDGGFTLRVDASVASMGVDAHGAQAMSRFVIRGFDDPTPEGAPSVPRAIVHIAIPAGTRPVMVTRPTAEAVVTRLDWPMAHSVIPRHIEPALTIRRDPNAYTRVWGEALATIDNVSYAGSVRLATVSLWPVRYDPRRRVVRHTPSFELQVRFVSATVAAPATRGSTAAVVARVVVNPWDVVERPVASRVDLVIAHESYRDELSHYITFKRRLKREARVHFVANKSAAEIKAIITSEYQSATPPTSTLLVGNISQIPAWRGSGDNAWTDFDYQNLDAGGVPDIALGRIPAHTNEELLAFLAKARARELYPFNNRTVLLTSGSDTSLGCPANVTKVGDLFKSGDESLTLVKKLKSSGASTDSIIEAYNEGPNLVVYDGHGNHTGMTEVPLVLSNINQLVNMSYPIVFDIACLNANWSQGATRRNFAEMILLKPESGVAGIMASGGSGYGHDFFQTIGTLSAKARADLATTPDVSLNEVGQVILGAKIKHGEQDRAYWNYYGDPATRLWSRGGGLL